MVSGKVLVAPVMVAAAVAAVYTCAAVSAWLDKVTAYNSDTVTRWVTLYLVQSGGGASATTTIVYRKALATNETYPFPEVVGHILVTGGAILAVAEVASVVSLRVSGREVT